MARHLFDDNDPLPISASSIDGANVTQGALADAAVGDAAGSINAHLRQVAKLLGNGNIPSPTISLTDTITRPAVATAYALNQSINCNVSVTALVSISGMTVTLTAANAFAIGDYITVAGVDGNFTNALHIDGNWKTKAGTNATTVVFDVAITPTGTPATATHGTIAKLLAFDLAGIAGASIILNHIKISLPGIAAIGALRAYVYIGQVPVLVDQSVFTLLLANAANRRAKYDLTPVTEGANSDCSLATVTPNTTIKCAPADTHIFIRLVAEAASTMTSGGVISVTVTAIQLLA
jgi:hypothetical protein